MKTPKAPAAPDPAKTAAAQGAANKDAAIASAEISMVDQVGPYGNITYERLPSERVFDQQAYDEDKYSFDTGARTDMPSMETYYSDATPRYQQTTTLDPSQQKQLDLNNQISEQSLEFGQNQLGQVEDALSGPLSFDGLPDIYRDTSADRQRVEDAVYSRMTSRLDDRYGRDQANMENQLANQGIAVGSEAYTNAMKDFDYGKNDAYQGAADQAIIAGGQEQNRLFGLDMSGRQQGIQERSLERSQPVNELATLLGLGGNVQAPQFQQSVSQNIAPVDYVGLANNQYNAQMNSAQMQNSNNQAMMSGLFGLGAAGIMR